MKVELTVVLLASAVVAPASRAAATSPACVAQAGVTIAGRVTQAGRVDIAVAGVAAAQPHVAPDTREQLARLRARASSFRAAAERTLTGDLARVNALVTASGLTPLARPRAP